MNYKFNTNETIIVPKIPMKDENSKIPINIPLSKVDYNRGIGETITAIATKETAMKYNYENLYNEIHFLRAAEDSIFYPGIKRGTILPVIFRLKKKPTVIFDEIKDRSKRLWEKEVYDGERKVELPYRIQTERNDRRII